MRIIHKDGGVLECCSLMIEGGMIYADDIYFLSVDEVERIED